MGFGKLCGLAALTLVAGAPVTRAATILSHYQFEDLPASTTVADSAPAAGGDNAGTLNGNATLVPVAGAPVTAGPGLTGQALSLDGNGDFVNLTTTSASILNGRSAFSIAAFVNITSYSSGPTNTGLVGDIFFVSHSGSAAGGRGVLQMNTGNGAMRAFARASTTEGLTAVDEATPASSVPLATWTHVAATYDLAGPNPNKILIYVNGVQVGGQTTQTFAATTIANIDSLFVGLGANNAGAGEFFNGLMDDVRLYDGVLTPAEVGALAVVPEPASMGVLGVGALALSRRRRRA